jgi:hypothetical protein
MRPDPRKKILASWSTWRSSLESAVSFEWSYTGEKDDKDNGLIYGSNVEFELSAIFE